MISIAPSSPGESDARLRLAPRDASASSPEGSRARPRHDQPPGVPGAQLDLRHSAESRDAGSAGAEHLDGVVDVDEPLRVGHPAGPLLDLAPLDLQGQPAAAADEVVVVL